LCVFRRFRAFFALVLRGHHGVLQQVITVIFGLVSGCADPGMGGCGTRYILE
jgi:hypothetical protein